MPYTIELRERSYLGPRIDTPLAGERFDTIARASAAAKHEAFHFSNTLGVPIAVLIADDRRTLIRHIVPARHDESAQPLYARHGLHTMDDPALEPVPSPAAAAPHPLIAIALAPTRLPAATRAIESANEAA